MSKKYYVYVAALMAFKEREGHCNVPFRYEEGDIKLGVWLIRQRQAYRGIGTNKITKEQIAQLEALGVVWDVYDEKWNQNYEALKAFKAREGHCNVPTKHVEGGVNIGHWLNRQRQIYNGNTQGKISKERADQFEEIGDVWRVNSEFLEPSISLHEFKNSVNRLVQYQENGKPFSARKRILKSDFKTAIRYAYGDRCAITGSKLLLELAHRGPNGSWSHENTKGILLSKKLYSALKEGILAIDPETGLVSIDEKNRDNPLFKGLHGKVVHIANLEGPVHELPRFKTQSDCPYDDDGENSSPSERFVS
jgi:hypothetical protein